MKEGGTMKDGPRGEPTLLPGFFLAEITILPLSGVSPCFLAAEALYVAAPLDSMSPPGYLRDFFDTGLALGGCDG